MISGKGVILLLTKCAKELKERGDKHGKKRDIFVGQFPN
jgi:hypothetical protein